MEMVIDNVDYYKLRATSYKLFANLFGIPQEGFIRDLETLQEVLLEYSDEFADKDFQFMHIAPTYINNVDSLKLDYAKLFVGPFEMFAPPYSTIYLENTQEVMGRTSMRILNYYKKAGLSIGDDCKVPTDHITLQLEFMYYLSFKYVQTELTFYEQQYSDFLDEILSIWIPKFTENVITYAQTPIYKELAYLLSKFVLIEWNKQFA